MMMNETMSVFVCADCVTTIPGDADLLDEVCHDDPELMKDPEWASMLCCEECGNDFSLGMLSLFLFGGVRV